MHKRKLVVAVGSALAIVFSSFTVPAYASTAESYDFDTAGQLANNFDTQATTGFSQELTGGIGNSGAIHVPNSLNAVFASKNSYSVGDPGSTYTFSSYMKSVGNNGYSGMGFSKTPATQGATTPYRPNDALGISVHGGGFVFHNGASDYSSNWDVGSTGSITAVRVTSNNNLLNSASPENWYKVIFKITYSGSNTFTMRVEVWPAYANGTLLNSSNAEAIFEVRNVTNSTIGTAPSLKSYINFSGYRMSDFDNFQVDLGGNAAVVAAGNPVVLTNSSSVASGALTFNGNVTSENGSTVTERGFVYGTSANPTTSTGTKITNGTGTGTFTSTTGTLAVGTYYVRAFATNTSGTSYGAQETIDVVGAPTISWAPTNTSVLLSAGSVTPSVAASSNSSGAISYAVQSAGTTNCTVNSSTGVVTYTAAGSCVIRATVAAASPYSSATIDKTFTISAVSVPGSPTAVSATAGNASATVSWTAPGSNGGSAITAYTATATPGGATCTSSAPATTCSISGLTNGTAYTFTVVATNTAGDSAASSASSAVTPAAPASRTPVNSSPAVPDANVQSIKLSPGKIPGTSSLKLKLTNSVSTQDSLSVQIKLLDFSGKVVKVLTIPLADTTSDLEVSVPLSVGSFTVEANTVNASGVSTNPVALNGQIVEKPYFTKLSVDKAPILAGTKVSAPIVFAPNSTNLSSAAKNQLLKLVELIKTSKSNIALTGFSAPAGAPNKVALAIAAKRSSVVAKFLVDHGATNWIFKSGYGVLPFSQSNGSPRKVEVRVIE